MFVYLKFDLSICAKCHVRDVGYPLSIYLLLFTKIYHHFKCSWSLMIAVISLLKRLSCINMVDIIIIIIISRSPLLQCFSNSGRRLSRGARCNAKGDAYDPGEQVYI